MREQLSHRSPLVDLSGEPDADAALDEWARGYADLMLDLSDRLFDSTLVRLSDDRWAWALLQHHLATDATSLTILVERLGDRYRRLADPADPAPVDYPQLPDYLSELEEVTSAPGYAATEAFWQERMTDAARRRWSSSTAGRSSGTRSTAASVTTSPWASRGHAGSGTSPGRTAPPVSEDFSLFSVFAAALFTQLYRISGEPRARSACRGRTGRPRRRAPSGC